MSERMVMRKDARVIAELACDLADKVHHWKQRALIAEHSLRKSLVDGPKQ